MLPKLNVSLIGTHVCYVSVSFMCNCTAATCLYFKQPNTVQY